MIHLAWEMVIVENEALITVEVYNGKLALTFTFSELGLTKDEDLSHIFGWYSHFAGYASGLPLSLTLCLVLGSVLNYDE